MDAFTRCDVCEMSPADTLYDVCEDALCRDVGEYAEEVVRRVARNEEEDLFDY